MTDSHEKPILSVRGISKSFGVVNALSNVDLDLAAGGVHALVGENGAGKSTLAKIISGSLFPDAGQMHLAGKAYNPTGRSDAEKAGIRMVMQELNLIANLSVAENIFIENLPSRLGIIKYKQLEQQTQEVMRRVGLQVDPSVNVGQLGMGTQQMVEIAAGLSQQCSLLILDEPTSSLTDKETELLFTQIKKLTAAGAAILYISHRLEEIMRIADMITVLRDGRKVSTYSTRDVTIERVVNSMVGRDLSDEYLHPSRKPGSVMMRVESLIAGDKVRDISFELRSGEILGVAGLIGSGRTETMRAIFGADEKTSGHIYLYGSDIPTRIKSPSDAVQNGIALLTEDRKEQGLFLPLAVRANISLVRLRELSLFGWIRSDKERKDAKAQVTAMSVKCSSSEQPVMDLSGGNQQKVIIAKWLYKNCDILIFDEPTRGIDVGAKFEIYRTLSNLAEKGKAIIMVSSELKELTAICDRIMVLSAGRIASKFDRNQFSEERINAAAFSNYLSSCSGKNNIRGKAV